MRAALGPEVGIVGLDGDAVVGFTEPEDETRLRELLAGEGVDELRRVDGWTVFAEEAAHLDAFAAARASGTLAGSEPFEAATEGLPDDALALVFARGEADEQAAAVAAAVSVDDDALRVDGRVLPPGEREPPAGFEAELPEVVPAPVLAYVSFADLERALSDLRDAFAEESPELERDLARLEAALDVSLEEDVLPLLAAEGALYVRPGFPAPELTLLLQPEDPRDAFVSLRSHLERTGPLSERLGPVERTEVAGVEAVEVPVRGAPLSLWSAVVEERLVVTTAAAGIEELAEDDERLADDDRFAGALEDAGVPAETGGFAYVDLAELVPTVTGLLGFAGLHVPPAVTENLAPLDRAVAWSEPEENGVRFAARLSVD